MTKRVRSWRVCPKCNGRATKLFHLNTGAYTCQQCEHEYTWTREEGPKDYAPDPKQQSVVRSQSA